MILKADPYAILAAIDIGPPGNTTETMAQLADIRRGMASIVAPCSHRVTRRSRLGVHWGFRPQA